MSTPGVVAPVSHLDTAWRVTKTFPAVALRHALSFPGRADGLADTHAAPSLPWLSAWPRSSGKHTPAPASSNTLLHRRYCVDAPHPRTLLFGKKVYLAARVRPVPLRELDRFRCASWTGFVARVGPISLRELDRFRCASCTSPGWEHPGALFHDRLVEAGAHSDLHMGRTSTTSTRYSPPPRGTGPATRSSGSSPTGGNPGNRHHPLRRPVPLRSTRRGSPSRCPSRGRAPGSGR